MFKVTIQFTYPVVTMYERDIPLGYVFTSPMTYHTVIYHIECDMSRIPQHITLNMVYHGVICHGGRKYVPKWYITLIPWYDW